MNTTAKIELALEIYRLCKTEPHFFRAWVHYHDTDRDVWRKETIPESQFGFVLAMMRNPTSNQEIGCITEFLDEEKEHIAGTPTVAYVPHDPEEKTMTNIGFVTVRMEDDYEGDPHFETSHTITVLSIEPGVNNRCARDTRVNVSAILGLLEEVCVEPEDVTINVEED